MSTSVNADDWDGPSLWNEKWVRVMCDYSADGLWDKAGGSVCLTDLPVSTALTERLRAWQERFEDECAPSLEEYSWDVESFSAEGLAIAQAIKAELPDWTIVYFDEAKVKGVYNQPRHEFEYEVASRAMDQRGEGE